MLKQTFMLEIKKGEKLFTLHFMPEATLGELHDVLYEMKCDIVNRIQAVQKQEEDAKKAAEPMPAVESEKAPEPEVASV